MDALFFISIACFFALFVAALAIARRVRIEGVRPAGNAEPYRQKAVDTPNRQSFIEPRSTEQSLRHLVQQKEPDWRFLIAGERRNPASRETVSPFARKPPASARTHRYRRPDWAHFNKDLGDLSDPYQPPVTRAAHRGGGRGLLSLPRKEAS